MNGWMKLCVDGKGFRVRKGGGICSSWFEIEYQECHGQ